MKRTPLKRSGKPSLRKARLQPRRSGKPIVQADEVEAREVFRRVITCAGSCAACGRPGPCHAHHILEAKLLKKLGLDHLLWDVRNGMPLGYRNCHCHESHTNRMRPVPRSKLPPAALEFAAEIDQTWRLDRIYPAD